TKPPTYSQDPRTGWLVLWEVTDWTNCRELLRRLDERQTFEIGRHHAADADAQCRANSLRPTGSIAVRFAKSRCNRPTGTPNVGDQVRIHQVSLRNRERSWHVSQRMHRQERDDVQVRREGQP